MAKRVVTTVVMTDDLTGEEIPEGQGESVRFVWDGSEYVIDLAKQNAEEMRKAFSRYVENSMRVGKYNPTPSSPREPGGGHVSTQIRKDREKRAEIRTWAIERGMDQSINGRIKQKIFDAWDREHPDDLAPRIGG